MQLSTLREDIFVIVFCLNLLLKNRMLALWSDSKHSFVNLKTVGFSPSSVSFRQILNALGGFKYVGSEDT